MAVGRGFPTRFRSLDKLLIPYHLFLNPDTGGAKTLVLELFIKAIKNQTVLDLREIYENS